MILTVTDNFGVTHILRGVRDYDIVEEGFRVNLYNTAGVCYAFGLRRLKSNYIESGSNNDYNSYIIESIYSFKEITAL